MIEPVPGHLYQIETDLTDTAAILEVVIGCERG